jgi:hyperosmotically inducible periplasmic protein
MAKLLFRQGAKKEMRPISPLVASVVLKGGKHRMELAQRAFGHFALATILASSLCLALPTSPAAQEPASPDNTEANKRDRSGTEPTADQQKENRSDRDITRRIRQAIVKDKSLSTYAHNIKVITQNGVVTLKGSVRSEDEKLAMAAKAAEVAGENNVKNELSVTPHKNAGGK